MQLCRPKKNFTLSYKQSDLSLWSFVLSAPDNNAYISVGFSNNGNMVGSSAMRGWSFGTSGGTAKQYYLGGTGSGSDCPPDQGSLPLVGTPVIVSQSLRLYLAFQLNTTTPQTNLIYAVGPRGQLPGSDNLLATHQDMTSTTIDYASRLTSSSSGTVTLRQAHDALGLLGFCSELLWL